MQKRRWSSLRDEDTASNLSRTEAESRAEPSLSSPCGECSACIAYRRTIMPCSLVMSSSGEESQERSMMSPTASYQPYHQHIDHEIHEAGGSGQARDFQVQGAVGLETRDSCLGSGCCCGTAAAAESAVEETDATCVAAHCDASSFSDEMDVTAECCKRQTPRLCGLMKSPRQAASSLRLTPRSEPLRRQSSGPNDRTTCNADDTDAATADAGAAAEARAVGVMAMTRRPSSSVRRQSFSSPMTAAAARPCTDESEQSAECASHGLGFPRSRLGAAVEAMGGQSGGNMSLTRAAESGCCGSGSCCEDFECREETMRLGGEEVDGEDEEEEEEVEVETCWCEDEGCRNGWVQQYYSLQRELAAQQDILRQAGSDAAAAAVAEAAVPQFDRLPDELLLEVLSKLDGAAQLAVAGQVSTRWRRAVSRVGCLDFSHLSSSSCDAGKAEEIVSRMVLRSDGLRELAVVPSGKGENAQPREFIVEAWMRHVGPTLRHLALSRSPHVSTPPDLTPSLNSRDLSPIGLQGGSKDLGRHMHHVATYCKRLETLRLSSGALSASSLRRLKPMKSLKELSLGWVQLTESALQAILNACPNLESFSLFMSTGCPNMRLTLPPKLRQIEFSYVRAESIVLSGSSLESITVRDMFVRNVVISSAPRLSHLSVTTASLLDLHMSESIRVESLDIRAGGIDWRLLEAILEQSGASLTQFSLDLFAMPQPMSTSALCLPWLARTCPCLTSISFGPLPWDCLVAANPFPCEITANQPFPKFMEVTVRINSHNRASLQLLDALILRCPSLSLLQVVTTLDGSFDAQPLQCQQFFLALLAMQRSHVRPTIRLPVLFRP